MTNPVERLILFAKAPVLGQVKSRIAQKTGEQKALLIYEQLLHHVLSQFQNAKDFQVCCYSDQPRHAFFDRYKAPGVDFFQQQGEDLGQRMFNALTNEMGNATSVVLIGSDCPAINQALVLKAFQKLASGYQVVIAPAEDGGYVLIGFTGRVYQQIFENINWGTDKVFAETRQKIDQVGLKLCQLETLADIDTYDDYQKWQKISGISQDF